jgi:hypothetical protein
MKQHSLAHVSAALLALRVLSSPATDPIESGLVQAQLISRNSGDTDVDDVTVQSQTGRAVFSYRKYPPHYMDGANASCDMDGGAASGALPHTVFGRGPISRASVPPFTISLCSNHGLFNGLPFRVAD